MSGFEIKSFIKKYNIETRHDFSNAVLNTFDAHDFDYLLIDHELIVGIEGLHPSRPYRNRVDFLINAVLENSTSTNIYAVKEPYTITDLVKYRHQQLTETLISFKVLPTSDMEAVVNELELVYDIVTWTIEL